MTNEKKVVLVVEDEKPLLDAIHLKLEKYGFEVSVARTVKQAKDCAEKLEHIDAIWLDHYLIGGEDGLDFIAWCREDDNVKCKGVPIFVVSNTASAEKVATYVSLGVEKYFVKSNHKLEEIIGEIVRSLQ